MAKLRPPPGVKGIATVERAASVLTAFRHGDTSLELTELAARTGLVKSTIMRFAVSLEKAGLLLRLPDGTYQLDAEVLRLGSVYQQSFDTEKHVLPVLRTLVKQFDETAAFYVRRGAKRLCLYRVDSRHMLRVHVRPGDQRPMDQASSAQVLRTFEGKTQPEREALEHYPLFSQGATDPHSSSLSMPVFGECGKFVGALTISGPITRLTPERGREIAEPLREAGLRLSRALGASAAKPRKKVPLSAVA